MIASHCLSVGNDNDKEEDILLMTAIFYSQTAQTNMHGTDKISYLSCSVNQAVFKFERQGGISINPTSHLFQKIVLLITS